MSKAITMKQIDALIKEYENQQKEIKKKLELIKNGAEFGEDATDSFMYGFDIVNGQRPYFPSKLLKVIDEETGLIEYDEYGSLRDRIKKRTVLDLVVVGYCK